VTCLSTRRSIGSWLMRNVRNAFAAEKLGDDAALLALIENSLTLQKSLAHAERETQRRSLEMQQHLAGPIRRGSRVFVGF
jgi:hypothetical protein